MICKPFERTNERFTLKDAICLPQEEWDTLTPEQETAMQDARWQSWLENVTSASDDEQAEPEVDPMVEMQAEPEADPMVEIQGDSASASDSLEI